MGRSMKADTSTRKEAIINRRKEAIISRNRHNLSSWWTTTKHLMSFRRAGRRRTREGEEEQVSMQLDMLPELPLTFIATYVGSGHDLLRVSEVNTVLLHSVLVSRSTELNIGWPKRSEGGRHPQKGEESLEEESSLCDDEALVRLLQRRPSLRSLRIRDHRAVERSIKGLSQGHCPLLVHLKIGPGAHLKRDVMSMLLSMCWSRSMAKKAMRGVEGVGGGRIEGFESLDLSHCRLEEGALEILAEGLKNKAFPSLQGLNLTQSFADEAGLLALAEALKGRGGGEGEGDVDICISSSSSSSNNSSNVKKTEAMTPPPLKMLGIGYHENNDGQGLEAILSSLASHHAIEELIISTPSPRSAQIRTLAQFFNNQGATYLRSFRLQSLLSVGPPISASPLVDALVSSCSSCSSSSSSSSSSSAAAAPSSTTQKLITLEQLCIEGYDLRGKGAVKVASALRLGAWPHLKELRLRSAGLRAVDVGGLLEGITESPDGSLPHLKILDLFGNSDGGSGLLDAVATAMREGCLPQLTYLDLGDCGIGNEGRTTTTRDLRKGGSFCNVFLCHQTSLPAGFHSYQMNDRGRGLQLLGRVLVESGVKLRYISLGWNAIGDEGMEVLTSALEEGGGEALELLGLVHVAMGEKGAGRLATVFERGLCPKLTKLQLGGNWGASGPGLMRLRQAMMKQGIVESLPCRLLTRWVGR